MVGHSPVDTIIKWNGTGGVDMFDNPTPWNNEIMRLTFDGSGAAGIIIDYNSGSYGGSGDDYIDDVFENASYGFYIPQGGGNDSNNFVRCKFQNLSSAGFYDDSFNGFTEWFIDSTFINDKIGIESLRGQTSGLQNVFLGTATADIVYDTQSVAGAWIGNVSSGSNQFFSASGGVAPMWVEFRANRISNTTQPVAIAANAQGNLTLIDNQILSNSGASGPVITNTQGVSGNSLFLLGNQYSVTGTTGTNGSYASVSGSGARFVEINDSTVASSSSAKCPQSSGTDLTNCYPAPGVNTYDRHCFAGGTDQGVCSGLSNQDESNAANIQADINSACPTGYQGGNRPVIHLVGGTFNINSTLTFPSYCDAQLTGDGFWQRHSTRTIINWNGSSGGTDILLHSPSKVVIQEIDFQSATNARAIAVNSEDVSGSRVQVTIANTYWNTERPMYVANLTNTIVNTYANSVGQYNSLTAGTNTCSTCPAVQVVGNGTAAAPSRLGMFLTNGSGLPNSPQFAVSNQGHLIEEGSYLENNISGGAQFNLTDSGTVTFVGGEYQSGWTLGGTGCNPDFMMNSFNGTVTLTSHRYGTGAANSNCGGWAISSPTNSHVLIQSTLDYQTPPDSAVTYNPTVAAIQSWLYNLNGGWAPFTDNVNGMSNAQIINQFAQLRSVMPTADTALPTGISDVQIKQIETDNITTGIDVEPGT
jgi:hypothetical protein